MTTTQCKILTAEDILEDAKLWMQDVPIGWSAKGWKKFLLKYKSLTQDQFIDVTNDKLVHRSELTESGSAYAYHEKYHICAKQSRREDMNKIGFWFEFHPQDVVSIKN